MEISPQFRKDFPKFKYRFIKSYILIGLNFAQCVIRTTVAKGSLLAISRAILTCYDNR